PAQPFDRAVALGPGCLAADHLRVALAAPGRDRLPQAVSAGDPGQIPGSVLVALLPLAQLPPLFGRATVGTAIASSGEGVPGQARATPERHCPTLAHALLQRLSSGRRQGQAQPCSKNQLEHGTPPARECTKMRLDAPVCVALPAHGQELPIRSPIRAIRSTTPANAAAASSNRSPSAVAMTASSASEIGRAARRE